MKKKKIRNNINEDVWFVKNDIVRVPRTSFYRNQDKKLTFNAGKLVPLMVDEILPGDTYQLDMNSVVRFASPMIRPVMDDVEMEAWAFFVPSRLVDDNFEKIIANYKANPDWTSDVETTLSSLTIPSSGFGLQSVGDYFGLPTALSGSVPVGQKPVKVSLLPFRAYTLIWDTFFRDQNLQNAITIEHPGYQALDGVGTASGDYMTDALLGGALCPLNKKHDLFTSALPAPQKGSVPTISIGGEAPISSHISQYAPVGALDGTTFLEENIRYSDLTNKDFGMRFGISQMPTGQVFITHNLNSSNPHILSVGTSRTATEKSMPIMADLLAIEPYADLSRTTGISVNDLRVLVQTQRLKEQDARYGSRYPEYLSGSWGVNAGDARLQRPEFLGKLGFNLKVNQTIQTSETSDTSAQSNVSAYSLTGNSKHLFTKSFVEHGYLIVVGGVRIKNRTYNQRVDKMWSKFARLDFYNPVFANLGEQPIKNKEIHYSGVNADDDGVFGYQEYAYEYRYLPNQVCGYMRPGVADSLSVWNYAENYSATPTLSPSWIQEDISPIDRTLAIPSETGSMFIADIYFKNKATRPMPLHSIPGLVDHSGKIII